MPTFDYTALDAAGKQTHGVLMGDSAKHIRSLLREQALIPLSVTKIEETRTRTEVKQSSTRRYRLKVAELTLLTRQLATLVSANIPLADSLLGVSEQTDIPRIAQLITVVRTKVLEGHSLAIALGEFPAIFSPLYCATVDAGEKAGHLAPVLERLADYLENQQRTRQKLLQALLYPVLMMTISIFFIILLLIFVVPQMVEVFAESGQQLPLLTRVLIQISDGLSQYGLYLLLVLVVSGLLFARALKKPAFRQRVQVKLLQLPLIGRVLKTVNIARFSRTLGILSSAGVPILEALNAATEVVTLLPIRESLQQATQHIREGVGISHALKQTRYFPPMSLHLIASGEASGQLEAMLLKTAASQDQEVETIIAAGLTIFEPVLILTMGTVVLLIVLAVLLPVFEATQFVGT